MSQNYINKLQETKNFLRDKIKDFPKTVLILGSGLGEFVTQYVNVSQTFSYSEIPNMPKPTTDGHHGNLVIGEVNKLPIAVLQGRIHHHDNMSSFDVCFNVRLMCLLGVEKFIISNAAGGLSSEFKVGDIMLINNHDSSYLGQQNDPGLGFEGSDWAEKKFYPHTYPYDLDLLNKVLNAAKQKNIRCHQGVYCFLGGPRFESAFEIQKYKMLGISAVGMSTVPEVLAIRHLVGDKAKILGVSIITNMGAGIGDSVPNHIEVKEEGVKALEKLKGVVEDAINKNISD